MRGRGHMKGDDVKEARRKAALDDHEFPTPAKESITATKQLLNQSDLALSRTPLRSHTRRNASL